MPGARSSIPPAAPALQAKLREPVRVDNQLHPSDVSVTKPVHRPRGSPGPMRVAVDFWARGLHGREPAPCQRGRAGPQRTGVLCLHDRQRDSSPLGGSPDGTPACFSKHPVILQTTTTGVTQHVLRHSSGSIGPRTRRGASTGPDQPYQRGGQPRHAESPDATQGLEEPPGTRTPGSLGAPPAVEGEPRALLRIRVPFVIGGTGPESSRPTSMTFVTLGEAEGVSRLPGESLLVAAVRHADTDGASHSRSLR